MLESTQYYQRWMHIARVGPTTLKTYQTSLKVFDQFLIEQGRVDPDDFSIDHFWVDESTGRCYPMDKVFIEEFIQWLLKRYNFKAPSMPQNIYAAVRNFMKTLYNNELIKRDPCEGALHPPYYRSKVGTCLTDAEYEAITNVAFNKDPFTNYYLAMMLVLGECGLRNRELRYMTVEQVQESRCLIRVDKGYKRHPRMVSFTETTKDVLMHFINHPRWTRLRVSSNLDTVFLHEDGRMLRGYELLNVVKELAMSAGITKNITPHSLRRTASTMMHRRAVNPELIRLQLGHNNLNVTKKSYIVLSQEENRESLEQLTMASKLDELFDRLFHE